MRVAKYNAVFCWLYLPAVCFVLILAITSQYLNIPISNFTRDPLAITGGHPFLGIISNVGIILWSFTVFACFYSYALLKTNKVTSDFLNFIAFGGFISFVLLIDDFFMLHDYIYPKHFGVSQKFVLLFYGLLILFYLVNFRKVILKTHLIFILLAFFFFSLSVLVDTFPESLLPWHHLFEDGPKFFGIVSWFFYQVNVCFQEVQSVFYTRDPSSMNNA